MDNRKTMGLALGLVIGIVLVSLGLWQAVVVAILALVGWLIGKFVVGEIPFLDTLLERFMESRDRNRRR